MDAGTHLRADGAVLRSVRVSVRRCRLAVHKASSRRSGGPRARPVRKRAAPAASPIPGQVWVAARGCAKAGLGGGAPVLQALAARVAGGSGRRAPKPCKPTDATYTSTLSTANVFLMIFCPVHLVLKVGHLAD